MRLLPKDKKALLKAALGQIPADLAIVNAKVFNVFTGEILPAIVYVYDGFIAHVEYDDVDHVEDAKQIYDAQGQYFCSRIDRCSCAYRKFDAYAGKLC